MNNMIRTCFGAVILALSTSCFADMILDGSSSSLSIFSAEKNNKKEDKSAPALSGSLSDKGDLKVVLDLKNISTKIPLPEMYLNKDLFEKGKNQKAILTAKINDDLSSNGLQMIKTDATIEIYGLRRTITVDVTVVRTGDKLIAASTKPAIISAPKLNLGSRFPSMVLSIPVSFVLVFRDKPKPSITTKISDKKHK